MDSFFTSLSKRQSMLLLTAVTFGGQESLGAMEHLPAEEGDLLRHRAQELLQIPRDKRIPALVQEIKRLVKDRRGQLWGAEPERLATLLQRERGALMEIVLRALPAALAEAVRAHLPPTRVKLTREVRPQVLDIVRWKLEETLARESGASQSAGFKFADVLMLQQRELLTVCDRLGARVLGPALAGLPDAEREALFEPLPPDLKLLATKSVAANAPRKLPEEDARAQLELHDGLKNPAGSIRSAGVQRLARACVAQSPEFAARMLEKYRGEFGGLIAKWVREERIRPTARGDGGRTDIVMDLERLASRGLIERPVRLASPPPPRQSAVLPPPPGARKAAAAAQQASNSAAPREPPVAPREAPAAQRESPAAPREASGAPARAPAGAARPGVPAAPRGPGRAGAASRQPRAAEPAARRDFMAERAARSAGAMSSREPARVDRPKDGAADGSAMHRMPARRDATAASPAPGAPRGTSAGARREPGAGGARREGEAPEPRASRPGSADPQGARIGPPPSRLGGARPRPSAPSGEGEPATPPARDGSRIGAAPDGSRVQRSADGSRVGAAPDGSRVQRSADGSRVGAAPEGSRVQRSADGSRVGAAPEGSRVQRPPEGSRVQRQPEGSRVQRAPEDLSRSSRVRLRPEQNAAQAEPEEGSRVFRSRSSVSISSVRVDPALEGPRQQERPPRVLAGRSPTSPGTQPPAGGREEGTSVQRRPRSPSDSDRPASSGPGGRGPRGGTR
ncbi:hypothetical protein MYSTI_02831 [Myxococcus stipitatus DSM 14675]|uniref:Uncharacterized protein n=1 Tax=Myxococcus stipitatus (strain DSM 14675 / JCM 12634 / Mx s8) TaxID=1278073 RepID=L7U994_MYXSD|nr:hypothetical protein [Myxococcus stipitatus]AGC44147.1 hypothetical protein MYSTI_02831 [Myxococcus stipitatus DSM 14675]